MKQYFYTLTVAVVALLAAMLTQSGCKENTLIRSKVLPANDTVGIRSISLPCITHTYYDNNALTSTSIGSIPVYQGVGVYNDPFFGTMTGATYFQVITNDYYNILAGQVIDSAVLVLPYSGFTYGDSTNLTATQTYQVFYILDTLGNPLLVNYYANTTKPIDYAHPLSDPTTINLYQLKDSFGYNVIVNNTPAMHIRLRLPELMQRLNPALNILSTSTNPTQDFVNAFNGLCVMPANTSQVPNADSNSTIPYFQLDGTNPYNEAGILVYYHAAGTTVVPGDTDAYEQYYFDENYCSHFNNITRSYGHLPYNSSVNGMLHSTQANDSVIVLQNQPGPSIDVVIPGIKSIPNGVIINNAQLQINLLPYSTPYYLDSVTATSMLCERMYPEGVGSATYPVGVGAGQLYPLADRYPIYSISPLNFSDGFWHWMPVASPTMRTYTLNLPREVIASIAAGNDTLHLHLTGTEDFYGAFKMVAAGGGYRDSAYRPKLFVVYSKLNN